MAENTSQFALDVRKCLHWALCLRQSACAKGIVSDSAGSYAQHPESTMESRGACARGKSCNGYVSMPSPKKGTQEKQQSLLFLHYKIAAKSCR